MLHPPAFLCGCAVGGDPASASHHTCATAEGFNSLWQLHLTRERSPRNLQQGDQGKSTQCPILFEECHVRTQGGVSKEGMLLPRCRQHLPIAAGTAFPTASAGSLWKLLRIHASSTGSGVLLLSCSLWACFPSRGRQFSQWLHRSCSDIALEQDKHLLFLLFPSTYRRAGLRQTLSREATGK